MTAEATTAGETGFFFNTAGLTAGGGRARDGATVRLYGILHEPSGPPSGRTFVFVHPLTEEKLWTHRVFVSFARQLAARGHAVLRFDARGNGDSDGEFSEASVETLCTDVMAAIDEVRRRTSSARVTLLGLRAGATVASLVAERLPGVVERLVLWAPVVDGGRYMQDLLRMNLTAQMAAYKEIRYDREALVEQMRAGQSVNVEGYEMTLPMHEEFSAIKLGAEAKQFAGPCLVVQVERKARPDADLQKLVEAYGGRATYVSAEEEPFWKEIARFYEQAPNLFARTLEWLA